MLNVVFAWDMHFNPRTREGCDSCRGYTHPRHANFNPRTREGCDFRPSGVQHFPHISIHAPARGATALCDFAIARVLDFNPRTREGCDKPRTPCVTAIDISIHAPARGATDQVKRAKSSPEISIHAPARGATVLKVRRITINGISIHAPARGATHLLDQLLQTTSRFQSTHPRGVRRVKTIIITISQARFQSTHPRGVRRHFTACGG